MLSFILAESELEMIPEEIIHHPNVVSSAKRRGKKPSDILLDSNFHHNALRKIEEGDRRGRPDIVHLFLLVVLESVANKKGLIKNVVVHTRNNDVIFVDTKTRIMRSYNRFVGLMEHLFTSSDEEQQFLRLERRIPLDKLVKDMDADRVIVCSSSGKGIDVYEYLKPLVNLNNIVFIIGGFPRGDFKTEVDTIADDVVSIYSEHLTAWSVAGEISTIYNLLWSHQFG